MIIPVDIVIQLVYKLIDCCVFPVTLIKHLVFNRPKKPSYTKLSGEHPFLDMERVKFALFIRSIQSGHR